MKTFAVIIINKNTFNSYFNTIEEIDILTAENAAKAKWENADNHVSIIPPQNVKEIANLLTKTDGWMF